MNDYYYSRLNKIEQAFYLRFLDAVRGGTSTVKSVKHLHTDAAMNVVSAVSFDHPELFFVDFQHLNYVESPFDTTFRIGYNANYSLREKTVTEIERNIATILQAAKKANLKTDFDKCRWIHNSLVRTIHYNYDALRQPVSYPEAFTVYGALCDHNAVCEGISKAFKLLCNRLGVEAIIVSGTSSSDGFESVVPHSWNIVMINGEYTHIDVTWDIIASQPCRRTRFDYFCLPDKRILVDHIVSTDSYPECTSDNLNYFSKTGKSFTDGKHLRAYLEEELKKGSDILYFRVADPRMAPAKLRDKIQIIVNDAISSHCRYPCSIEMSINEKQQCYFYRLTRQE